MRRLAIAICAASLALTGPLRLEAQVADRPTAFRPLFNGKDLKGWSVEGGDETTWTVEDGSIVAHGRDYRTRNCLLSDREYSDFVLRLEYSLDAGAGSAVVIRGVPDERMPYANGNRSYDHPMMKLIERPGAEETGMTYWLRAVRWQYLLAPIGPTRFRTAFRATIVGFAASFLLPARAG